MIFEERERERIMSETRSSDGKHFISFCPHHKHHHTEQKDFIIQHRELKVSQNRKTERTIIKCFSIITGTKEKTEETKKTSDPETPKSLLGAQSLYKYRPPRVDKVMYQIEVPPMLSLSERKIEHERVMSSVAKDFSNPILVWPGESDVKSEEEESNNLRYV